MERHIQGANKRQTSLVPMCLDDMISLENPVRAIKAIVERGYSKARVLVYRYEDNRTQTI